jgi:transcriptional regulator with GAF, ATPase, and Fis domain
MLTPIVDLDRLSEADGNNPSHRGTEMQIEALRNLVLTLVKQLEMIGGKVHEPAQDQPSTNLHDEVRRFEIDLINHALYRTQGHQLKAAQLLGIKTTTLNSKIKRYHIMLPFFRSLPEETH